MNVLIVLVFIGFFCGAMGFAGWVAEKFGDALTASAVKHILRTSNFPVRKGMNDVIETHVKEML